MAKVIPQYIRTVAFHAENENKHTYAFHLRQCADELEQAQAEIEKLKYDKSPIEENLLPLQAEIDKFTKYTSVMEKRVLETQHESDRYRQALKMSLDILQKDDRGNLGKVVVVRDIIDEALEGSDNGI